MKDETIQTHVRTVNGILASMETNRKLHGQTAKERRAAERLQEGKMELIEELQDREEQKPALS